MKQRPVIFGVFLVVCGAASYGLLATIVQVAYNENYTTGEVVFSQYLIGLLVLGLIYGVQQKKAEQKKTPAPKQLMGLVFSGTSMGFTGIFYYQAIHYLPVSICIILLMQSIWIGVVTESFLQKKLPNTTTFIGVLIVLVGTVFATRAWADWQNFDAMGLMWGLLAAVSYATTIYAGNKVGLGLSASTRSFWMMLGGFVVVLCYVFPELFDNFKWLVFWRWGVFLAIFGTIAPPILFNKGLPITGLGLGSILASFEIPVSIFSAFWVLNEQVGLIQWIGVAMIVLAVVFINLKRFKKN